MNKQDKLDEMVKKYSGKFPTFEELRVDDDVGGYSLAGNNVTTDVTYRGEVFSKEQFQQRARELGYGVEAAEPESWYCYETQKALRLPPVGETCQMYAAASWFDVKVIAEDDGKLVVKYLGGGNYYSAASVEKFYRPLDHATRKAEAEREKTIKLASDKFHNSIMADHSGQQFLIGLGALYDAGFLRMPEEK